jgi:predicted ATPase
VGRTDEVETLAGTADAARSGRGSVVLVGGEPGIGKTRLAARLAADAAAQGAAVLFGAATEDAVIPYEALIEALGESEDYDDLIARLEEIDEKIKELLVELKEEAERAQP